MEVPASKPRQHTPLFSRAINTLEQDRDEIKLATQADVRLFESMSPEQFQQYIQKIEKLDPEQKESEWLRLNRVHDATTNGKLRLALVFVKNAALVTDEKPE
jgi:hypothetical protein